MIHVTRSLTKGSKNTCVVITSFNGALVFIKFSVKIPFKFKKQQKKSIDTYGISTAMNTVAFPTAGVAVFLVER